MPNLSKESGLPGNSKLRLQLRPGSECAMALTMIQMIIAEDLYDHEFVEKHGFGFDRLADHVRQFTPEWAAPITRVSAQQIRLAARTCATTRPSCLQWGNGIDTSINGFQTGRATTDTHGTHRQHRHAGWRRTLGAAQRSQAQIPTR